MGACTRVRVYVTYCIEMLRAMYRDVLARRSLGKTTSRLSNYRSCIMHRSLCRYLLRSLSLSLPLRVSLSRPLSRLIVPLPPSSGVLDRQKTRFPEFRGQSCGSAGISCGGDPLSDFLRRERMGDGGEERVKKGGIGKCSDCAGRRRIHLYAFVKHVYTCIRA